MNFSLFDLIPEPVLVVDENYKVIYLNKKAKETYEVKGDTCFEITHNFFSPCYEYGEHPCPVKIIKDRGLWSAGAVHVHRTKKGDKYFYVIASSGEGFYVELHVNLSDLSNSFEFSRLKPELLLSSGPIVFFLRENKEGWPVRLVSPNVKNMFGYSAEDFISGAVSYKELIHPEDLPRVAKEVKLYTETKAPSWTHEDYRIITKDGKIKWVLDHTVPVFDDSGNITHYYGYIIDITEKHEKGELFRKLAENNPNGVILYDFEENKIMYANKSFAEITEYSLKEILSLKSILVMVHPRDKDVVRKYIRKRLSGEKNTFTYAVRVRTKTGRIRWVKVTSSVITYGGKERSLVTIVDITNEKIRERKLRELATRDQLTRSYNRHALVMFLEKHLYLAQRYGTPFSVILIDIDNFKKINDTYGHITGDKVLKTLARVVKRNLRRTDIFGRWGGEEFLIILPFNDNPYPVAEKIRRVVSEHRFEKVEHITISLGATSYIEGDDMDSIITRADEALYEAKRLGKNRVVVM